MHSVTKSSEVVCNNSSQMNMAGGISFPETVEIETLEWGYNSDFVEKFDEDILLVNSQLRLLHF